MKKVILLMSVIGLTFLMTSCLNGETAFSGTPLSYITTTNDGFTIYALTLEGGYRITSAEIRDQTPGDFVVIDYSWSESLNTVTSEGIYNATVNKILDPIGKSMLNTTNAPALSENETPLTELGSYMWADYVLDNKWVLLYSYKKGDGEKKALSFYHNLQEGTEDEIIIDVRVVEDTGTIDKDQSNVFVSVDLTALCNYYTSSLTSPGEQKTLRVYFQYPVEKSGGTVELQKSQAYNIGITKQ